MEQSECTALEKEIFLREQMISLYLFAIKTIVALSSSALALNAGFSMAIGLRKEILISPEYVAWGWFYLLLSFVLSILTILLGIKLQYTFFNNIQNGEPEFSFKTQIIEFVLQIFIIVAFSATILSFLYLLTFSYVNFLA